MSITESISIIYKDFIQIGKRNTKTLSGKRVLAKYRHREFAETELHCPFVPPLAVGETVLDRIASTHILEP